MPPARAHATPPDLPPCPADGLWRVYLVECADGTYYLGITNNLPRRLAQHNGMERGGARYTRSRRPVRLRAAAPCADKSNALKLECRLRALPRQEKIPALQALHTPADTRRFLE